MPVPQHFAVYTNSHTDRLKLCKSLIEDGLAASVTTGRGFERPALYSNVTLQEFVAEELRHDRHLVDTGKSNLLAQASSGEQRQALLRHLLGSKPDLLVLDNVLESLDVTAQRQVLDILSSLGDTVLVVQLFDRKHHLLPFINRIFVYEADQLIQEQESVTFRSGAVNTVQQFTELSIPPPLQQYAATNPLVQFEEVYVSYEGRPVLNGINWTIRPGEFWQLKGPNGSGKSTILSMITGDNPKAYGQNISIFGQRKGSGETVWSLKERIGYLTPLMLRDFERPDSIEHMLIAGLFDSVGLYIKPSDRQRQLALDWLKLLGLYERRHTAFPSLTAGEQRLVLIARAMIKHPPLLILDEPASGLDDHDAALFATLVNKIAAETNTAILYVSHLAEKDLQPRQVFELIPATEGSIGKIITA